MSENNIKQTAIISGKGGTGKTVLTAALGALIKDKVMVDCDVDAADLHLLLHPTVKEKHTFVGGQKAEINLTLCRKCGRCVSHCRFNAIKEHKIDPILCEGCGLCKHICPFDAVKLEDNIAGEWFVSETKHGPFVHAKLGIAEDNSGKLVARIRQAAKDIAEKNNIKRIFIDGPPGIGCPVMASLSGVSRTIVVTEPTVSGIHDAERVIEMAQHFQSTVNLVINKWDLNPAMTEKIAHHFKAKGVEVAGKIAFNPEIVKAMVQGKNIVEYGDRETIGDIVKISVYVQ